MLVPTDPVKWKRGSAELGQIGLTEHVSVCKAFISAARAPGDAPLPPIPGTHGHEISSIEGEIAAGPQVTSCGGQATASEAGLHPGNASASDPRLGLSGVTAGAGMGRGTLGLGFWHLL